MRFHVPDPTMSSPLYWIFKSTGNDLFMGRGDNSFALCPCLTFSMLNFSKACVAKSTASCCISSFMSAFLITAFRSDMFVVGYELPGCALNFGPLLVRGDLGIRGTRYSQANPFGRNRKLREPTLEPIYERFMEIFWFVHCSQTLTCPRDRCRTSIYGD